MCTLSYRVFYVSSVYTGVRLIRTCVFFCQAEDGIRDLVRSRGLGDVYKRQQQPDLGGEPVLEPQLEHRQLLDERAPTLLAQPRACLLYTSDAADERSSVDLGGRRIIKKKTR